MGFQDDLVVGFATLLNDAGVGTWKPTEAYAAGETAIVSRALPQSPDRVITLATYGVADDLVYGDDITGLQVTTRWGGPKSTGTDDLTDLVFDALQALPARTILSTGIVVTKCFRRSMTSIGQDTNNRWRTTQNFYVTAHRPSTHRQ